MILSSFPAPFSAVIVGAGGGIGAALAARLAASDQIGAILALSRRETPPAPKTRWAPIDLGEEASIAAAAALAPPDLRLVLIATGLLHADGLKPEKRMADWDGAALARSFAVNAIGPALAIKHFARLLPRDGKSAIAALSARVSSIGDNRLGGWTGYRASKAALNMIVKNAAIELAPRRPEAVVLALHPGTVDTALSKPFQAGVAPEKLFAPDYAAERLLAVIDAARPDDSGALIAWDGARIPY